MSFFTLRTLRLSSVNEITRLEDNLELELKMTEKYHNGDRYGLTIVTHGSWSRSKREVESDKMVLSYKINLSTRFISDL